jgi:hypothetical protein
MSKDAAPKHATKVELNGRTEPQRKKSTMPGKSEQFDHAESLGFLKPEDTLPERDELARMAMVYQAQNPKLDPEAAAISALKIWIASDRLLQNATDYQVSERAKTEEQAIMEELGWDWSKGNISVDKYVWKVTGLTKPADRKRRWDEFMELFWKHEWTKGEDHSSHPDWEGPPLDSADAPGSTSTWIRIVEGLWKNGLRKEEAHRLGPELKAFDASVSGNRRKPE